MNLSNVTIATLGDFKTDNYSLSVGPSVSGLRESGEVYKLKNDLTGIVEHETTILFEALGYLKYMEENLQALAAPFFENKVDTPEV